MVIAIIAILAGLLLPALSSTREKGRRANCVSNLHQIGIATAAYANDYNDFYPIDASSGNALWISPTTNNYGRLLAGYIGNGRVFYCPSGKIYKYDDSSTGYQFMGVAGGRVFCQYYFRGTNDLAPRKITTELKTLIADMYRYSGTAPNHDDGVCALWTDGAVRFVRPAAIQFVPDTITWWTNLDAKL